MTTPTPASLAALRIEALTRTVADFPEPGIQFKDLSPLFADAAAMELMTEAFAEAVSGADLVAGIDSRGFLIAAALGAHYRRGVVAVRKAGKLPPPVLHEDYQREYGPAAIEIPAEGLELAGRTVVIVDDVLATGGSVAAAHRLLARAGARVTAAAVIIEIDGLAGRTAVAPLPVFSLSHT